MLFDEGWAGWQAPGLSVKMFSGLAIFGDVTFLFVHGN